MRSLARAPLALFAAACSGSSPTTTVVPPASVSSVSVSPAVSNLTVGQTITLHAIVQDSANNLLVDRPTTWATTNGAAVTVSAAGLVTAIAPGNATITATVEGKSANGAVTVSGPAVMLELSAPDSPLSVGQSKTLSLIARDAAGNPISGFSGTTSFTSSAPTVATFVNLRVTALSVGTTTITATIAGLSSQQVITVIP